MLGDKLRFRFSKTGTLRLLSHHDLMRCFERILRRADVPFKSTAGFHPSPRVVFALSLGLGVVGRDEAVEIEFTQECESEDVLTRLNAQAPDGLGFKRASVVPMKATALPRRMIYTLELPADRVEAATEACRKLMGEERVWVDRFKPKPKQLNIRPYFRAFTVDDRSMSLDLWVTQTGTARADELLKLLGLSDLVDSGYALSRDLVELRDEITGTADPADQPPDGPADTLPLDPAAVGAAHRDNENTPTEAQWGSTLSGPVVE